MASSNFATYITRNHPSEASMPLTLDLSREAALQMTDAPEDSAQNMVSLWQNNLVAFRAEQYLHWQRAHDAGVIVLDGVTY